MGSRSKHTYRGSGVDVEAADRLVSELAPLAQATARAGSTSALGGFGAVFDLAKEGFLDPVLVSATDGVGTKLLLACEADCHEGIGIDLVAMSVNDVLVQGAEPLFFLDYFATNRLDVDRSARVLAGIAEGCRIAGCALVGGETAELPGLYGDGHYDLAGFAVGAVEREMLLPKPDVIPADEVLAIASDGLHANGFSLVRAVLEDTAANLEDDASFAPGTSLGKALLQPTRIYVAALLPLLRAGKVKALAHITGGGLSGNLVRVLPDDVAARIDASTLKPPSVFRWLKKCGRIDAKEMFATFNCGIGMVLVCAASESDTLVADLESAGETAWKIGTIEARADGRAVTIENQDVPWKK